MSAHPIERHFALKQPMCVPVVKGYKQHIAEDIGHKTVLLFVKCKCAGNANLTFSSIGSDYLERLGPHAMVAFPYVLT